MPRKNDATPPEGWPGTGEERTPVGLYAIFDKSVADWQASAIEWADANVRDSRARRTVLQIVAYVPTFIAKETLSDGRAFACFSVRQMSASTGRSTSVVAPAVRRMCDPTGPLTLIWKPRRGDSSRGSCYALQSVAETCASVAETCASVAETCASVAGEHEPVTATENANAVAETTRVPDTENAHAVAEKHVPNPIHQSQSHTHPTPTPASDSLDTPEPLVTYGQFCEVADRLQAEGAEGMSEADLAILNHGQAQHFTRYQQERIGG